ncbi:hypothetical protein [Nostoc sp. 2RC]|jgi:hypothetical protein|uniref:hypothetical protein n=1 Tax=Nostoc sp. 2RC TaxID=2485484 RepID=UPI0021AB25E4|nr:hypothetical protein [Nostoc sp. 2RC]
MPENRYKINLPWSEEHEAFCYQNHIPPAAKSLWQWLMRQGETGSEIEPDLSEFNAWVEKVRGKKYTHNYLKQMFELLQTHRVVQVVKQYSWKIFKLHLHYLIFAVHLKKFSILKDGYADVYAVVGGNIHEIMVYYSNTLGTLTNGTGKNYFLPVNS